MGFQKIQIGPLAILGPRVSSRSPGAPEGKKWQFWLDLFTQHTRIFAAGCELNVCHYM